MSTDRAAQLTPQDLALKLATREAVEAAGGQVFAARELERSQSRISDYCSENTAEFIPLPLAVRLEALGAGKPGHPHITRALARAAGAALGVRSAAAAGFDDLGDWLAAVARDNAELTTLLARQDLSQGCAELSANARSNISREARELMTRLEQLCRALDSS